MNALANAAGEKREDHGAVLKAACAHVAPNWPLDAFIAVNPWWERRDQGFAAVDAQLRRLGGAGLAMPGSYYRAAWEQGEITAADLHAAMVETSSPGTPDELVAALRVDLPAAPTWRLLSDVLEDGSDGTSAPTRGEVITQQLTQFCAAWFDEVQADWHPARDKGLYAAWLEAMRNDRGMRTLLGMPDLRQRVEQLPTSPEGLVAHLVSARGFPSECLAQLGELALFRIKGWAAWCAYLTWQARLAGGDDQQIHELLAARLAWECLLDEGRRGPGSAWQQWVDGWILSIKQGLPSAPRAMLVWQRAQEIAWQRAHCHVLARAPASNSLDTVEVQAVFCIDVRSEVFRRALESADPGIQTLGFAGFFGLPLAYTPLGSSVTTPLLPGLLAPSLRASDATNDAARDALVAADRKRRWAGSTPLRQFKRLPIAGFTLVESIGIASLGKLISRSLSRPPKAEPARPHDDTPPRLDGAGEEALVLQAGVAARALGAMGLTQSFAPLVLLVGHGSQTSNNPHAAGLDCGACGGHSGEINARVLAGLLNDTRIRQALAGSGINIPPATTFVAALHNTVTDEVTLFDTEHAKNALPEGFLRLQRSLSSAGERARAERAPGLALGSLAARPAALLEALRTRTRDWAQTRPEWGLANNAAFIVAPRARTRSLDLQGRAFLHDYDEALDADGSVLELIMTAPMIVTQWINLQYFASTVDNPNYGSGNKVLHNVVGGRIGVFEGNGGDLRIGLPLQSVHDGARWRHAPLRLSVFIEASRSAIETVIRNHLVVRQIVDGQWLHLFRLDGATVECYRQGTWQAWPAQ